MVFDWFQRRLAQPQATDEPPAAPEAAGEPSLEEATPEDTNGDELQQDPPPEPAPQTMAALQGATPATPDQAGPAASGSTAIDADALAWAREAYARLKAEQQATRPTVPPSPAAEALSQEAPAPEAPPLQSPATLEAPSTEAPPAPPLSLLEQAAAERRQRQQELMQLAVTQEMAPAAEAPPAAPAPPAQPSADEAEPTLGDFDEAFTWSAEVLAAQGRRADEVSLEEIDWLARLRRGMEKTRKGFVSQLLERLGDDPLTPEVLDDLESTLLRADVGVQATDQVLDALRARLNQEVVDGSEGLRFLKEQLRELLEEPIEASGRELLAPERDRLNIWLMVGVNGVGKTTTLGKLANLAVRSGYSCLIAAADTFRAAAVEQVRIWGERSGVTVISNPSANADPASVVYDAISSAKAKGTELVLVDTAGRLQTKHNLMEELSKVRRIVDKLAPEAAVESLLVLDASQGQNGLRQAMAFAKAAGLTGVVITKLDGSSRGGVALAVCREVGLPIRFIGAGEGLRDLRPFNSFEFVEALLAT
ncbi:MAG: signal recognition particle-docking protein FtsY [Cyanobacteriota bacterium]|nr:signal recognition particle-docking protein FtsY [Cyanobacteriota bacterium]